MLIKACAKFGWINLKYVGILILPLEIILCWRNFLSKNCGDVGPSQEFDHYCWKNIDRNQNCLWYLHVDLTLSLLQPELMPQVNVSYRPVISKSPREWKMQVQACLSVSTPNPTPSHVSREYEKHGVRSINFSHFPSSAGSLVFIHSLNNKYFLIAHLYQAPGI